MTRQVTCPSPPVDMWSVGCIMAELLTGQALFPGGDRIPLLMEGVWWWEGLNRVCGGGRGSMVGAGPALDQRGVVKASTS